MDIVDHAFNKSQFCLGRTKYRLYCLLLYVLIQVILSTVIPTHTGYIVYCYTYSYRLYCLLLYLLIQVILSTVIPTHTGYIVYCYTYSYTRFRQPSAPTCEQTFVSQHHLSESLDIPVPPFTRFIQLPLCFGDRCGTQSTGIFCSGICHAC